MALEGEREKEDRGSQPSDENSHEEDNDSFASLHCICRAKLTFKDMEESINTFSGNHATNIVKRLLMSAEM